MTSEMVSTEAVPTSGCCCWDPSARSQPPIVESLSTKESVASGAIANTGAEIVLKIDDVQIAEDKAAKKAVEAPTAKALTEREAVAADSTLGDKLAAAEPPQQVPNKIIVDDLPVLPAAQAPAPLSVLPTGNVEQEPLVQPALERPTGCLKAFRYRMEQQEPTRRHTPYIWFSGKVQVCCAGAIVVIFFILGFLARSASSSIIEVAVSYKYPDARRTFTIVQDMSGDVNMWYDLPDVIGLNTKRYIDNADSAVIKLFLMGKKKCKQAEHKSDVAWRRNETLFRPKGSASDKFTKLVERVPGNVFRPCGLQSIAMFTDEFTLHKKDGAGQETKIALDESTIVLDHDHDIFKDKIIPYSSGTYSGFKIDGELSWLEGKPFLDHYKVWMRSPASPHVRNLWAVVKGGLSKGEYVLKFSQNSAIWTASANVKGWDLDEKKVIFSTQHKLGSKGACEIVSIVCFALAALEVIVGIAFVMGSFINR